MPQMIRWTLAISNAQRTALRTVLASVNGDLEQDAVNAAQRIILNADPDGSDAVAWLTSVQCPRIWHTRPDGTAGPVRSAIEAAGAAVSSYRELVTRYGVAEDVDDVPWRVDRWLSERDPSLRRDGVHYGLGEADGTDPAQNTSTAPILINQWTGVRDLVGMTTASGNRFTGFPAGEYRLLARVNFTPVEGVTFGFRVAIHDGSTWSQGGTEVRSDDGQASGTLEGTMGTGYSVALSVRSSQAASFQMLAGSVMRLERIAT